MVRVRDAYGMKGLGTKRSGYEMFGSHPSKWEKTFHRMARAGPSQCLRQIYALERNGNMITSV